MVEQIERLSKRQEVYEERVGMFSDLLDQRDELFERARSLSQICDTQENPSIVLRNGENMTVARIYSIFDNKESGERINQDTSPNSGAVIHISNKAGSSFNVSLPWAYEIQWNADHYAKKGKRYITPIILARRALSIHLTGRDLDNFSDTMGELESAAEDPELNFELSGICAEIADVERMSPGNIA